MVIRHDGLLRRIAVRHSQSGRSVKSVGCVVGGTTSISEPCACPHSLGEQDVHKC